MRIAQVSTLASPVRQNAYGSVESLIWLMTRELARLGHEVTVFGVAGSEVDGEVVATLPGPYGEKDSLEDWHLCEWVNLCQAVQQSGRFDVLHSHAYLWGLPAGAALAGAHGPHHAHRPGARIPPAFGPGRPTPASPPSRGTNGALSPICARRQSFRMASMPPSSPCKPRRRTTFVTWAGSSPAREPARRSPQRAPPACGCSWPARPALTSGRRCSRSLTGKSVEYVGSSKARSATSCSAAPKRWSIPLSMPESFGLVLVEAMLCGTPVAAMRLGAVPEIVDEGVTGFSVESLAQMPEAIASCCALDRRRVRQVAEATILGRAHGRRLSPRVRAGASRARISHEHPRHCPTPG